MSYQFAELHLRAVVAHDRVKKQQQNNIAKLRLN